MKIQFASRMRDALVIVAIAAAMLTPAAFAGPMRVQMTVNGTVAFDNSQTTNSNASGNFSSNASSNGYSGRALMGYANAFLKSEAEISTAGTGESRATGRQQTQYPLWRPAGAAVAGGKFVVSFMLDAELVGDATADQKVTVEFFPSDAENSFKGEASGAIPNQPGRDTGQVDVTIPIPADFPSTGTVNVAVVLELTSVARVTGAAIRQDATAEVNMKALGFRVFNAAGEQVPGFAMSSGSTIPELAPSPPGQVVAEEFFNPTFGHYFLSSNPVEIANLKAATPPGWIPTGQKFNVFVSAGAGLFPVCRFFSGQSFAPRSSHFYTGNPAECAALRAGSVWTYEGVVFYAALPESNGGCPVGQTQVYRLFNNGAGGAPNHRFTTSQAIKVEMLDAVPPWLEEGPAGVGWCSPLSMA